MTDHDVNVPATGRLAAEPQGKFLNDTYRFVATHADGHTIVASDAFHSTISKVSDGKKERQILENVIAELGGLGWQAIPSANAWYEHRLHHVGRGNVMVALQPATAQRGGLSPAFMWGCSVLIILALFAFCVVLALTSEIRFTPVLE